MRKLTLPLIATLTLAVGSAFAADKKGFDALDKDNDGNVTKAEAKGNAFLSKNFDKADRNDDGKLNRAEYLAVMTRDDVKTGAAKVDHAARQ